MARQKTNPPLAARDTFHVLGPDGERAVKGAAPHALNVAQRRAEMEPEPITLTVERQSLFGPATPLYRVVRDEHGTILTFVISQED